MLVCLGMRPVDWLSKPWAFSEQLRLLCFSAMGTPAIVLNALLVAHVDDFFQRVKDRLSGFLLIVVTLNRLRDAADAELFHSEVVEELYDINHPDELLPNKRLTRL